VTNEVRSLFVANSESFGPGPTTFSVSERPPWILYDASARTMRLKHPPIDASHFMPLKKFTVHGILNFADNESQ
jgi:hypothetical protein